MGKLEDAIEEAKQAKILPAPEWREPTPEEAQDFMAALRRDLIQEVIELFDFKYRFRTFEHGSPALNADFWLGPNRFILTSGYQYEHWTLYYLFRGFPLERHIDADGLQIILLQLREAYPSWQS